MNERADLIGRLALLEKCAQQTEKQMLSDLKMLIQYGDLTARRFRHYQALQGELVGVRQKQDDLIASLQQPPRYVPPSLRHVPADPERSVRERASNGDAEAWRVKALSIIEQQGPIHFKAIAELTGVTKRVCRGRLEHVSAKAKTVCADGVYTFIKAEAPVAVSPDPEPPAAPPPEPEVPVPPVVPPTARILETCGIVPVPSWQEQVLTIVKISPGIDYKELAAMMGMKKKVLYCRLYRMEPHDLLWIQDGAVWPGSRPVPLPPLSPKPTPFQSSLDHAIQEMT